jgi:hypothetical protein
LSAAFEVDFGLDFRVLVKEALRTKIEVKGGGQECPPHTARGNILCFE